MWQADCVAVCWKNSVLYGGGGISCQSMVQFVYHISVPQKDESVVHMKGCLGCDEETYNIIVGGMVGGWGIKGRGL